MSGLFLLTLMSLLPRVTGFTIIKSSSWSHQEITKRAILNVTTLACRAVAEAEGLDFTFPASFTIESVAEACAAREAAKSFGKNIRTIKDKNAAVDVKVLSSRRHFDGETFKEGKKLITDGLKAVKSSIKKDNMKFARSKIGEILHTLQDFYSHSNWIEMGNDKPNSNVISKQGSIGKIADKKRPTCRDCDGDDCTNNILEDILEEKVLTSGYFYLNPYNSKPSGKCSHGDFPDASALLTPKGGINKDSLTSSHGHLHNQAATVAVDATLELLNDVRSAAGDKEFLRMLGLIPGKALCFVIDTTGSMRDDIATVKKVTSEIIKKRVGTKDEPSFYILVPFNDPDFGPLMRTTDANEFKKAINALTPNGGGDLPEMSLSGLQLGLTGAPLDSEIYLFTDAAAKDSHLKSTVAALIEKTGSVVNFMITSFSNYRRRRSNSGNQHQIAPRQAVTEFQVYNDLAAASGGQAVEMSKNQLLEAINVVLETSTSSVVTLLQVARYPGKSENVTFTVDDTVTDLTIYITGTNKDFILISPTGVAQESTTTNGSLFTSVVVGKLQALMLNTEVGLWEIRMVSTNPYSLKITAKTPIDFFFSFMQPTEGPFEEYTAIENRPKAGANGTMMVKLIGSDMANVTEVYLVYSSGSGKVKGTVSSQGNGEYLVQFDTIPSEEFTVVVKGQNGKISSKSVQPATFQRQSSTSIKPSSVSVTIDDENDIIEPGATLSMNFTVSTNGSGGTFSIRATNDQSFSLSFPETLEVVSGSSTVGTLQLSVPTDAESGTEVTLTVEAEAPDGDVNYGVLMVTVLKKVTDVTRPVCELLSLRDNCTETCGNSTWQLSVRLSDGVNGTGIVRVYHRQGNGTLNTTVDANDTVASYEASCCSPTVEIITVDAVGNVGSCSFTTRVTSSAMTTAKPTDAPTTTPNSSTTVAATTTTTAAAVSVAPKVNQSFLLCLFITLLAVQHK
ncbi:von Willebrand factor A domain-containing protein 7-like isoform X3 [Periophthalmus magnuspinnatus]|uniref:von Willebrand factor A domain-containing protein 7-like isoform X3 n=1 Tax=Periophthalmus magnuspinnatus TaxID=409849 RepID=UPI002436A047|nr:von Willebrand factor A domain-containing protein 7-like isoform X3 [Periophthalmus magnuspinnatus]